jgi:hypothetical protein
MNREAVYEAWVPQRGDWSLWARPVLFGQMPERQDESPEPVPDWPVDWAPSAADKAVLLLDLPGAEAVHLGLALARRGYRPVPLYNGCTGPGELIDQGPIVRALRSVAPSLASLTLPADAPPAFLLDSRRQSLPLPLQPGMLDNRWKVFPEELPSGQLLHQRGVSRVVLVQRGWHVPQDDLSRVLRYWQEALVVLEAKDVAEAGPPRRFQLPAIRWYVRWWHGLLSLFGLQRSPRDGFGYIVPRPSRG